MMNSPETATKNQETHTGINTAVRFIFVRHSQKQSAEVYVGNTMSQSNLSEGGITRSQAWGESQLESRNIAKGYATKSDRTKETLAAALTAAGVGSQVLQSKDRVNAFFAFPESTESSEVAQEYDRQFQQNKKDIMEERYPGQNFDELSPDQQEEIAEKAEEPVVDWYLSHCDTDERIDPETPTTREHAAAIAFKINRLINLPDFMPIDSEVDLVSCGHKTSTEAFLKHAIILGQNGDTKTGFDSLAEIGGSLKILDSWDLNVVNDSSGEKNVSITIRRENGDSQDYRLDLDAVRSLASEHMESSGIKAKKIDKPLNQ